MIGLLKVAAPASVYMSGLTMLAGALGGKVFPCLCLLIPLFPLQNIYEKLARFPLGKDFNDILLGAMAVGWIAAGASRGRRVAPTPFNGLLIAYFLYTLFTLIEGSFYLGAPVFSLTDVRVHMWKNYMVFVLLFFLVVNNVADIKKMKRLFTVMLVTILLMEYYTVPQIRWMSGIVSRTKLHGTFVNLGPNEVSAFFATYVFVLIGVFQYERSQAKKALLGTLIAVCIFIVLFMYSRGAYLAVLAGALVMSFLKNRALFVPLVILVICWQILLPGQVVERIKQTESSQNVLDASAQKRIDIWNDAIRMFQESPVTGVGFATLAVRGLRYGFADPHNTYLKMLTEQGVIGLIFLLVIFFKSFSAGIRLYRGAGDGFLKGLGLGFACCVAATMVGNLFGNRWTHLQLGAFYWIFLALVIRGNIINSEMRAAERAGRKYA